LVLIVKVLKKKGFGEKVRRRGLKKGFREGKEDYKVVRY
jgi:hypothetical protein